MIEYAPIVENTIVPAFIYNAKEKANYIKVPFQHSQYVGRKFSGMSLRITKLNSAKTLCYLYSKNEDKNSLIDFDNGIVKFNFKDVESVLKSGQYYKFQIAYYDGGDYEEDKENLKYSSVAIGRYLGVIDKPIEAFLDNNKMPVVGKYKIGIASEPLYSYKFDIFEGDNLIDSSGEVLWTGDATDTTIGGNTIYTYETKYFPNFWPKSNKQYKIEFSITTANGYSETVIIAPDQIQYCTNIYADNFKLYTTQFYRGLNCEEEGSVCLYFKAEGKEVTIDVKGTNFIILRKNLDKNKEWQEITKIQMSKIVGTTIEEIKLNNGQEFNHIWKDFNIESGIRYKYGFATYTQDEEGNITEKSIIAESVDEICPYFDSIYLSDSKRMLGIKYNPKVSSFKNTLLESKSDTVGEKFPFFFRNNLVKYKEFPISGLISYLMDDQTQFLSKKELGLDSQQPTTDLVDYNYNLEKKFKLEVLDWLNNGEAKLFRSPQEGNYVVRLLNVSLSPEDTLGRLIHTFSATAYECAETTMNNLIKENVCKFQECELKNNSGVVARAIRSEEKGPQIIATTDYISEVKSNSLNNQEKQYSNHMVRDSYYTIGEKEVANGTAIALTDSQPQGEIKYYSLSQVTTESLRLYPKYYGWQWRKIDLNDSSTIKNKWNDGIPEIQRNEEDSELNGWVKAAESDNITRFEGVCFNIIYETTAPGLETYIYIDGIKIINTTGRFTTPTNMSYSSIEIPHTAGNYESVITFSYIVEEEKEEDEQGTGLNGDYVMNNSITGCFTLSQNKSNETIAANDIIDVINCYTLILNKVEDEEYLNSKDYQKVKINDNIIDISDGMTRTYKDLSINTKIEYGPGVQIDYCGRYIIRKQGDE